MKPFQWYVVLTMAAVVVATTETQAQRPQLTARDPHIGYVYPAGGQRGSEFDVTVGGQYLNNATDVYVSGAGVQVTVGKYTRPLNPKEANDLREKLQEARKRVQEEMRDRRQRGDRMDFQKIFLDIAKEMGVTEDDLKGLEFFRKVRTDPKVQLNPAISETVVLHVKLASDANLGERELRVKTGQGLSNPMVFHIGQLPEYTESEPNDETADRAIRGPLPAVVNGQIMPGDVDRFSFEAQKDERVVVAVSARELIPYLADAVPGWFQATLALYDIQGKELAYADDFRFHPDPVLNYEIPEDGQYILEIKDAIYRGREDFVYRIAIGELPYVTSVFPLGARQAEKTAVEAEGWNLPKHWMTLDAETKETGIHPISVRGEQQISNRVPFAVDTLPEVLEAEPNNDPQGAQRVWLPVAVNGRIETPRDRDVYRLEGHAGETVVAEVFARRLNSPLDSVLRLTDADGQQLAANDDHEDKRAALTTHQADSRLSVTLPADGTYYLYLSDTQGQGSRDHAYRLLISPPRPDFELRVVPSSINVRPGLAVPITVYALRNDGFEGDITLSLKDAPPGFFLSGAWVPAGQDEVRLTVTAPMTAIEEPIPLTLEGHAVVQGQEIHRLAVAAEDMMQAFAYRHLVPAQSLMVSVSGRGRRSGPPVKLVGDRPVKLRAGGTTEVRFFRPGGFFFDKVDFELSKPQEGIDIADASLGRMGVSLMLRVDAGKIETGQKGNLIVEAFTERNVGRPGTTPKDNKQRFSIGVLPAIPFEIVD